MLKTKVGMFVPGRDYSKPKSMIDNPGTIPSDVRDELVEKVRNEPGVTVDDCVDFRQAVIVSGKAYLGDNCLNDYDVFFWYGEIDRRTTGHCLEVLDAMVDDTYVISNPNAMRAGLDKALAHHALHRAGVPVADYAVFKNDRSSYEHIAKLMDEWGPVLIKPRLGAFGHGIIKVDDHGTLRDVVGYTRTIGNGMLNASGGGDSIFVERFYENDPANWTSTTIIGDTLTYGYRKQLEKFVDGWKVFDEGGIGGCVDFVVPTNEQRNIAFAAQRALALDVVGFDMIKSKHDGRYIVVDENTFPGFYPELFAQAGINPVDCFHKRIMSYVGKSRQDKAMDAYHKDPIKVF
ncbi:hypothetical protein K9M79_00660 [Candidatus Woesearchaeota archaeon]|nr:hypothetical protein [Candidatus Woesearchaeota archaeon]